MSGLFRGIVRALQIRLTPTGTITATNVQEAINQLDSGSVKTTGDQTIAGSKTFTNNSAVRIASGGANFTVDTQSTGAANIVCESTGAGVGTTSFTLRRTTGTTWNWQLRAGQGAADLLEILRSSTVRQRFTTTLTEFQNSPVSIADATTATSTTTGALTVTGGIGVGGAGFFGGTLQAAQFRLSALNTAPASATATGNPGEIRIDGNFIYVCISTNSWRRTALSIW